MNEVQVKDKGAESVAVAEKPEGPKREWESLEALEAAIASDTAVREDFLANEKDYKVFDAAKTEEAVPEVKETKEPAPEVPAKKKVTLEVDDDMLGTYATGREADAAVLEALKGNKEKDKTINFLKDEKLPSLERELQEARQSAQSLKKQIEEFEKKKAETQTHKAEVAAKLPEMPEFGDDDDLITDPKAQQKLLKAVKGMKDFRAYAEGLERQIAETKAALESVKTESVSTRQLQDEFSELDRTIQQNQDLLGKARGFKAMQDDYIQFMDNLRTVSGIMAPLMDEKGAFSKEVQDQFTLFHSDTEDGKALKAKCAERNVALPDDFEALTKAYAIRQIRTSHFEAGPDGNPVPISYAKAAKLYAIDNPPKAKPAAEAETKTEEPEKKQVTMSDIEKKQKAAAALAATKDLPADSGAVDIDNYPTAKFLALLEKPRAQWTDFDINLFKRVAMAKQATNPDVITDEWINSYLNPPPVM